MYAIVRRNWLLGLTVALGAMYGWTGLATHGVSRLAGLLGAVLIIAALAVATRARPAATALLIAGALPLAIMTWWSLLTPILAGLTLTLGLLAIRRDPRVRMDDDRH